VKRLVCALIGIASAGCVGEAACDGQRDVAMYRAPLDTGIAPPTTQPVGKSLSLRDAMRRANFSNEQLAQQGEQLVRAIADKRRSVAALLPAVDLAPSLSVREATGRTSASTDVDVDFPLELRWTLFDGGQNVNAFWRDVYRVEAQRESLLEAQESLLYDVANVYYTVLRAEAQERVLVKSLSVQEERLREARGKQAAELARPLDVAQVEAQAAETRVQLIESRRQIAEARSLLGLVANVRVDAQTRLPDGFDLPTNTTFDVPLLYRGLASARRSELRATSRAIEAARRDLKVATGQYYPTIALDASAWLYRESAPSARDWQAILDLRLPLFDGGRIEADVRAAWSFLREAILVDSYSRRRVTQEVDQSLRDIRASRDRLRELGISLRAADEASRQAEAAYQAGLGTNLERVTAQEVLLRAELAFATEQIDQKLLRLRLLRAAGVLREALLER
jgi:outer membrane protein TolC